MLTCLVVCLEEADIYAQAVEQLYWRTQVKVKQNVDSSIWAQTYDEVDRLVSEEIWNPRDAH